MTRREVFRSSMMGKGTNNLDGACTDGIASTRPSGRLCIVETALRGCRADENHGQKHVLLLLSRHFTGQFTQTAEAPQEQEEVDGTKTALDKVPCDLLQPMDLGNSLVWPWKYPYLGNSLVNCGGPRAVKPLPRSERRSLQLPPPVCLPELPVLPRGATGP